MKDLLTEAFPTLTDISMKSAQHHIFGAFGTMTDDEFRDLRNRSKEILESGGLTK